MRHFCIIFIFKARQQMPASKISLQIHDLKMIKVGLGSTIYYLKVNFLAEENNISHSEDLLQHQAAIRVPDISQVKSIEVWRKQKCRKVAHINLIKPKSDVSCERVLQKYNLIVRISQDQEPYLTKELSNETASSEGEQNESIIDLLQSVMSV